MITIKGCMINNGGPTVQKDKSCTLPAITTLQGIDHKQKKIQTFVHTSFISRFRELGPHGGAIK